MVNFEERIKRLEERSQQIQAEKQRLLNLNRKQRSASETKKKIIIGALLISQSKVDISARKMLARLVGIAGDRDRTLLNELLTTLDNPSAATFFAPDSEG